MTEGNLERFDAEKIRGWVRPSHGAGAAIVEIWVNNRRYDLTADIVREDLAQAFGGAGNYGFEFDLGSKLILGANHVRLKIKDQNFQFPRSSKVFPIGGEQVSFFEEFRLDQDLFRFKSGLEEEVAKALPASSPHGQAALKAILRETKIILVLFSNRTGSNLVTDMLEQMKLGRGATNEPFLAETIISTCKKFNLQSVDHYLAEIIRVWRSNGVCFLKISWDALFWLSSEGVLQDLLPHAALVWTKRRDKVSQAISYLKAIETGSFFQRSADPKSAGKGWHAIWKNNETLYRIGRVTHNSFIAEARIGYFLALFELSALEIYFEDMVSDLPGAFIKLRQYILGALGTNAEESPPVVYNPKLQKQSSDEDDAIRRLFLLSIQRDDSNS